MFELLNLAIFSDFYRFAATQPQERDNKNHSKVNLPKHFNVHERLYRQFLIKTKYICDSGLLSFNFGGVCKIDVQQTL